MPTDYQNYQAGPDVAGLVDILDYATFVRVVSEDHPGFRGSNIAVAGRHGAVRTSNKRKRSLIIPLEVGVRYTDSTGTVTSSPAEHALENHFTLKNLLGGAGPALLRRDAPHLGIVETTVEMLTSVGPSQTRSTYLYLLEACDPSTWRATSSSTASAGPIVVGGNFAPSGVIVKFFNGTNVSLTVDSNGTSVGFEGTVPAAGHQIDVDAGTATAISGGADVSATMTAGDNRWFELLSGSNAVTYAGGGTWSVDWYDQWA